MTEYKTHNNKDYVCVDTDAEPLDSDTSNKNGALFYPVRTTCGSLRCPPYKNHTEMMCAVCRRGGISTILMIPGKRF